MRWTLAISVALLLALAAYAGSAAVSLDGLVQAAKSGDGPAFAGDPLKARRNCDKN